VLVIVCPHKGLTNRYRLSLWSFENEQGSATGVADLNRFSRLLACVFTKLTDCDRLVLSLLISYLTLSRLVSRTTIDQLLKGVNN
jgi:hypothetical protein